MLFTKEQKDCLGKHWKMWYFPNYWSNTFLGMVARHYVQRPKNKNNHSRLFISIMKNSVEHVMQWNAFSGIGIDPLMKIRVKMNSVMYKDILKDNFVPYWRKKCVQLYLFQHINDLQNTYQLVKQLLSLIQNSVLEIASTIILF